MAKTVLKRMHTYHFEPGNNDGDPRHWRGREPRRVHRRLGPQVPDNNDGDNHGGLPHLHVDRLPGHRPRAERHPGRGAAGLRPASPLLPQARGRPPAIAPEAPGPGAPDRRHFRRLVRTDAAHLQPDLVVLRPRRYHALLPDPQLHPQQHHQHDLDHHEHGSPDERRHYSRHDGRDEGRADDCRDDCRDDRCDDCCNDCCNGSIDDGCIDDAETRRLGGSRDRQVHASAELSDAFNTLAYVYLASRTSVERVVRTRALSVSAAARLAWITHTFGSAELPKLYYRTCITQVLCSSGMFLYHCFSAC